MKMNKMTNYAIRTLRTIYRDQETVVTSRKISLQEGISQGVLMKILRRLKSNGIVRSHQGRGELSGGFSLIKSPDEMTILEIILIMEDGIRLHDPSAENDGDYINLQLEKLSSSIVDLLGSYKLSDIWDEETDRVLQNK